MQRIRIAGDVDGHKSSEKGLSRLVVFRKNLRVFLFYVITVYESKVDRQSLKILKCQLHACHCW